MIQDQYSRTLTHSDVHTRFAVTKNIPYFSHMLRVFLCGLGLALLLICIEAVLWLLNPAHLFGVAPALSTPWLLFGLIAQTALLIWLTQIVARPLAILAYLTRLSQEQERYRTLNTSLQSWSAPYEVPLVCYKDDPDPTRPRQAHTLHIPELIEDVITGTSLHLLLLGAQGAGKTLFLHAYLAAASRSRREYVLSKRLKIPVLLPLTYYALFLQALDLTEPTDFSLLDFLTTCDFPTLAPLRPYLKKLFQQGRVLLLCDGLDEMPGAYRPALDQELTGLFRQNRNALLLTSTPHVYEQSPELIQAVGDNRVPRAVFAPLELTQMRGIVERFIREQDSTADPQLPTAGQIMATIGRTRLRTLCQTPFYLLALLEAMAKQPHIDPLHLDTRGRLLSAFVSSLEERAQAEGLVDFLGELACVARWYGDDAAIYLADEVSAATPVRHHEQGTTFLAWLPEQRVMFPFAPTMTSTLALRSRRMQRTRDLTIDQLTSLLDLSSQNIVSFHHPLLASALLADYFARMLGTSALDSEAIEAFPDDLARWSEPLTLWAGLLDQPLYATEELAQWAEAHPEQRVSALVLSLICLGVAHMPATVERPEPLPATLAAALRKLLSDQRAVVELAVLFMRCAEHGSPELYQALFPLLALKNIQALLTLLNPALVADLFFQRLLTVIDDVEQEELVKHLVRALSCWGEAVVPRASLLCASPHAGGRLRTAAINILGGTRANSAVEPLISCLHETDPFIAKRAAHALARLGPHVALSRLLEELATRPSANTPRTLHRAILPIIERFLNETEPTRQLTPTQNQRVIDALMALLATHTDAADVEQVREILVNQGRLAEERESGKITLNMLVQHLTASNERVARNMSGTLKEVGPVATPHLLEQLAQQPAEAERVRILEVLASLQDERALPALLRLLDDTSPLVQQTLVATFVAYTPTCIPGLIDVLLHHTDDLVAARAEHILGELGMAVVEPVVQTLVPLVAGRTLLLVHILDRVRDARAVPALIELLEDTPSDVVLTLALVQTLGHLADERAVSPLLTYLAGTNALLAEGALNALSSLGELACPLLLAQLATPQKTPLVTRIERVLLGMQPFPGERLLQVIAEGNAEQARTLTEVFLNRGTDAAQLLVDNLFHKHKKIREYVRQVLERMDGRYVVPALLTALSKPDHAWHALLTTYLLRHPREAIPALVGLLDDPARHEIAISILLQAGSPVLPALVPALDANNTSVQACAKHIILTLVQQQPKLLTNVVQLFALTLPERAREALQHLLIDDLVEQSQPALLAGLEDTHMVYDVADTLVHLAHRSPAYGATVLEQLLQALRVKARRSGAALTLINLGTLAVPGVGALITDADPEVGLVAKTVLSKIGTPALAFLWAAQSDGSDPARRAAAREVFRAMPGSVIKDELVTLLTSARQEDISMALTLLLERIHDEALQPGHAGEMLPALLTYVQSASNELASLRILALLILLGGPTVIGAVIDALYADPQGHTHLISALLLLGQGVEAEILTILRDPDAPARLHAEVAGVLAMRAPQQPEVRKRALSLSEHGLWAGRSSRNATTVLQPSQLDSALRSLGGLLVAGHWDASELEMLRADSKARSAEREIYDMLLGWRYSPQFTRLEQDLENERETRRNDAVAHARELLVMKTQLVDVENELETLRQEHDEQHHAHERKNQEFQESLRHLGQEKQELQNSLRQAVQEKSALAASSKQVQQEKEHSLAEAKRWQEYSQQLERELTTLRRPKPNA